MNKYIEKIFNRAEGAAAERKKKATVEDLAIACIEQLENLPHAAVNFNHAKNRLREHLTTGQTESKLYTECKRAAEELDDSESTSVALLSLIVELAPTSYAGRLFRMIFENSANMSALRQINEIELRLQQDVSAEEPKGEYEFTTKFLNKFGTDLCLRDERNPLIGREEELRNLNRTLLRRDKPNVILTGGQGVGKTAIVEEFALRVKNGKVPVGLQNVKAVFSVEISGMLAGSQFRGQFEEKIRGVLNEAKAANGQVILFIDEIHTMMRSGTNPDDPMDAANIIKPYLTDGSIRIIGATTTEEYRRFITKDKAMARRFAAVDVPEPSVEDAIKILDGIKSKYEEFHKVTYTDKAIKEAVEMTNQFVHDRLLPDKAIDLIDIAGARKAAQRITTKTKVDPKIDASEIQDVMLSLYKIPKGEVKADETAEVRALESNLQAKVFGQQEAVDGLVKRIKIAKAGLRDINKPIANFLFVGPTGVGKTEISKVLAESLKMKLLRFDMSEYTEEHTVAKLFGSPAGYVGYEDGGLLTNAVSKDPHCVLLFDEIEKAHPKIYNALLQIMDYGIMTDSQGKKVDFKNTVIIMTSNAGARSIVKKSLGFGKAAEVIDTGAMDEALKATFPPEFRGRLTDVIKFNDISPEIAAMIVKKELKTLSDTLIAKGIKMTVSDKCVAHIAEVGYTPMVGARNIKNVVSNDISNLLVDDLLFGDLKTGASVRIDWNGTAYTKTIRKPRPKRVMV